MQKIDLIKFPKYFLYLWIGTVEHYMGVSENVVYPEKPNGFADHYPY